jgi:hypothetical protein
MDACTEMRSVPVGLMVLGHASGSSWRTAPTRPDRNGHNRNLNPDVEREALHDDVRLQKSGIA